MPRLWHRVGRTPSWVALVALILTSLVLAVLPAGLHPQPADAAVRQPFAPVFSTQENGAVAIVGNSQMSCLTSAAGCATARAGSGSNAINNSWNMQFLDADSSAQTTNSTSADLAMPAGSTVLYARLVWGGRLTAGSGGAAATGTNTQVKLQTPSGAAYTSLTAGTTIQPSGLDGNPYQASLDVTSLVSAAGNGTYWVGNIAAGTGADRYAGWSLVVAYRNPSLPLRDLVVFEGFADVTPGSGSNVSTTVSGFITPAAGTVNATVGFVSWEGDLTYTGDNMKFGGTILSDAERPSDNTFDSSISSFGAKTTTRSPNYPNALGVDMGRMSANGILPNRSTSTTVNVSTDGDAIYLGLLTTEIDLYSPSFVGISKTVSDLSGNSPAQAGDTLEYTLSFTNSGADYADALVARDPLPANLTYVPGSLRVTSGAGASTTPKTDGVGDDVGEYVSAGRLVRFRLGTGATSSVGGTLAPNASTSVSFRATLDRASSGTTVDNGSFLDYRARTLARNYTFVTNTVSTPVTSLADLAITKTSTPTSQTAGGNVTYTLNLSNAGPNDATGVVATDTLPAGATFVSANPPAGVSCSRTGQVVTCTVGTLANGATLAIPITAAIAPTAPTGSLQDIAQVSATTTDDHPSDNTATAATTVTRSADLRLTTTGGAKAVAGGQVGYTVTVTNAGPSTANAATVTDALPAGLSYVSANPSAGSCSNAGNTISCTFGDLAPGATRTVAVVGRVSASYPDATIVNTAVASSVTPEANAADNTDSATTTISRDAELALTKTAAPDKPSAGTAVVYTLTVTNSGLSDATDVVLTDPAPSGMTFDRATPTQGTCNTETSPLSCALGVLSPGASARVTLTGAIGPNHDPGALTNTATVTTTTAQGTTGDDTASVTSTVVGRADVALTKVGSPDPVTLGDELTYTLTATNSGPSQARGVVVTDTLPREVTLVKAPGCTVEDRTVSCPLGAIDVDDSDQATITVLTPDGLPEDADLTNTAVVQTSSTDPNPANDTASFTSGEESLADLSLTKDTSPDPIVPGQSVHYTLTATNAGPSVARDVVVTDTLPTGVSFVSATPAGICSADGSTVTCRGSSLAAEGSVTVVITGAVDPGLTELRSVNRATITADRPDDPTKSNNTATSAVDVRPDGDLSVQLTAETPEVRAGDTAEFTVTVHNTGPSSATGVVVTGQVPDGLDPLADSTGGACTVSDRTFRCVLSSPLPPDQDFSFPIKAVVDPSLGSGSVAVNAYVGSTSPDDNAENNSDYTKLLIRTEANLSADKSVSPSPIAGLQATYTITATNHGPSDAQSVTVTDPVPAGLSHITASPSTGTCTVTDQLVSCTADRLAADTVLTVLVTADVSAALTGTVTNTATIGSATAEATDGEGDDTATISTDVVQTADLRLTKLAGPDPVLAGQVLSYTLSTYNAGPSDATGVSLTDVLPPGLTFVGVQNPADVSCGAEDDTGSCSLGTVAAGATKTVTVLALVDPGLADGTKLTNTATLDSPTPTTDPDGRTASVTSSVSTAADLSIAKTSDTESPLAGGKQEYVLTVANSGPSTARHATIDDTLPDDETFVSAINPAGPCVRTGQHVSCAVGDLPPGAVAVVQVAVTVAATAGGGTISNTATVDSATDELETKNNTATLEQRVSAQNDLQLTKTLTSGPVVAGQPVTYTLTVTNAGPSQAHDVQVSDPVLETFGYASSKASGDGTCAYDPRTQSPEDDDQVTCSWPVLDVGKSRTATVTLTTPATLPAGSTLVNTATAASDAPDPTPAVAVAKDPVTTQADLSIAKTLLSGVPVAGGEVRWQILVSNAGPSLAGNVRVNDVAPPGVAFTAALTAQGTCTVTVASASCALGTVGADPATVTVVATLAEDYRGTSLTNTAAVTSDTADPTTGDHTASVTTSATATADLAVTTTGSPSPAVPGQDLTWTVVVRNLGLSRAAAVTVTDPLPAGVTLGSATLPGGSCATGSTVICRLGSLASGSSATLTVVGRLASGYALSSVADTASASASTADPNPLNNASTATTPVLASTDLNLHLTGPSAIAAGSIATWQIAVGDTGPSDALTSTVSYPLPTWLTEVTGTFPGGTCSATDGVLSCPVGTVKAGQTVTVTVLGRVPADRPAGTLATTATVTSAVADANPADNTDSLTSAITRLANVSVSKVADTTTFTPGNRVDWTITVSNAGPSTAETVRVADAVPAGVTGVRANLAGVDCPIEDGVVHCDLGTVAPGIPVLIAVTGTLDARVTAARLANTAEVTTTTPDPDPTDNTNTAQTRIGPSADLSVGKEITTGTPVAGAPIGFRLVVASTGPSLARHVVLTDSMPDQVTITTVTTPVGSCAVAGQDITCDLGDLAAGDQVAVVVDGTVGQAFDQTLANAATVSSDTDDPDTSDNTTNVTGSVDEAADLAVSVSAPANASGGDLVEWTVHVRNDGPSDAREVSLANLLPEGVSLVSATADNGGACSEVVVCDLGRLSPDEAVVVTVRVRLSTTYAAPTLIDNVGLTAASADPDTTDNTASARTDVSPAADLSTTLTVDPTAVTPGEDADYTLVVTNHGPSTAKGVTSTYELPAGLTLRPAGPTSDDADCQVVGRVVSCFAALLDPQGTITVHVPVHVPASYTGAEVVGTARAGAATPDLDRTNNTDTLTTVTAPRADLTLTKTGPAEVKAGAPLAWRLVLRNAGPSDAQSVVVTDPLPSGIGDVVATTTQGSCSRSGSLLTCALGTLADGGTVTIGIQVVGGLDPGYATGDLTNVATATSPTPDNPADTPTDPSLGRRASSTTQVVAAADVEVYKVPTTLSAVAGTTMGWTVTVVNRGPSVARGVRLSDPAVAGLTDFTVTPPDGVSCTGAHVCTIGDLPPGLDHAAVFAVSAGVPSDDGDPTLTNQATATSDTTDPDPGDDTARSTVPVTTASDLAITKTADTDPVVAGRRVSWTLQVSLPGSSDATGVVVDDTLPAGLSAVRVDAPDGVDCTTAVHCTIGTMAVGDRVTITVSGLLDPDYSTPNLLNTATVTGDQTDPNPANNTASAGSPVTTSADLRLTKTGPTGPVTPGDPVSWTLTLRNHGPSTAQAVTVTDTVPAGVGSVAVEVDEAGPVACTVTGNTVGCQLSSLAGDDQPVEIVVTGVLGTGFTAPELTNTATVSSATTPDPDSTSNTATATTAVAGFADLSVLNAVSPDPIVAGASATFTIRVANAGPSVARNTRVLDTLAPGMTITGLTTGTGSCSAVGQVVTCALGDLAAGGDPVEITLTVDVAGDFDPDGFADVASVLSNTSDPDTTNNTARVAGSTTTKADLHLTKTADVPSVAPGGTVVWTLTVHNDGPATARDVVVADQLPSGVDLSSVVADTGACTPDPTGLTCLLGDLDADATATVTVTGTGPADLATDLVNSATVQSRTTDPDTSDNTAARRTPVRAVADLHLAKVLATDPVVAGRPVSWTLTVGNDGPSVARQVVVTDVLPAGVTSASGSPGCALTDRTVTCTIAELAAHGSTVLTLTGDLAPSASGELANTATVTSAAEDPHPSDNTATATAPITQVADLGVTKTASSAAVAVGDTFTYTVAVTDHGPSDASGGILTESWPAGLELVDVTASQGRYDPVTRIWTLGTVPNGVTATLTLSARATGTGPVVNSVKLSGGGVDPNGGNAQAAAAVTVRAAGTPDPTHPRPGTPGSGSLPNTGGPALVVLLLGLGLVLGGGALLGRRRLRRPRP